MRLYRLVVTTLTIAAAALAVSPAAAAGPAGSAAHPPPQLLPKPTFPSLKDTLPHLGHNEEVSPKRPGNSPAAAVEHGKLTLIPAPRSDAKGIAQPRHTDPSEARHLRAITSTTRVMAVGDSITQGWDGDYTWRYWLARSEAAAGVGIDYVGPYTGTNRLPTVPAGFFPPPTSDGAYRVRFDSAHDALWGWTISDATARLRIAVDTYRPSYLLVELGWNDLNAGASAATTFSRLKTLVRTAQGVAPTIRIVVATVPTSPPSGYLPAIRSFDSTLKSSGSALSTSQSRVVVADVAATYSSTGTYDGLHPNSIGEHSVAACFQQALVASFRFGIRAAAYAGGPDMLSLTAPAWITATPTTAGIKVAWAHVTGARGYWFYSSNTTVGEPWILAGLPIHSDSWTVSGLVKGDSYRFKIVAHLSDTVVGPESATAAASNSLDKTPDPPPGESLSDVPGANYVDVAWGPPANTYGVPVTQYDLAWIDRTANSAPQATWTSSRSFRIAGLIAGHAYDIVLSVETSYGGGRVIGFLPVRPGYGTPPVPSVMSVDPSTVYDTALDVSWTTSPAATAYFLYAYDTAVIGAVPQQFAFPVPSSPWTIGYLFPNRMSWAACVQAINGTLRSPLSTCVRPDDDVGRARSL